MRSIGESRKMSFYRFVTESLLPTGAAQYALDLMIQRVTDPKRKTFGKYLYEHGWAKEPIYWDER